MMYRMKNIISHDEKIDLPKCMYNVKNPTVFIEGDDVDVNISNQGQNSKMTELEQRQDQLLKKLDVLYDRIKTISSFCHVNTVVGKTSVATKSLPEPEEVVLVVSPDSLPWYLNVVLKEASLAVNVQSHIHSSVGNEKVVKINNFLKHLPSVKSNFKVNLRLIFKNADTELKLSSLALPIIGNVNILRYLSFVYPSILPYDFSIHHVDNLLDVCHLLERTTEKNKEAIANKLFSLHKDWILGNSYSIVDLAAYNIIKQWKSVPKYVPKVWFDKCDKLCS